MSEKHRCEWIEQPGAIESERWACAECEAVSSTCVVTDTKRKEHPTETSLLICQPCLDYEAKVLDHVADALGHWRYQPRSLVPAIRYDKDASDGGAADGPKDGLAHPGDIVEVLWSWAEMWAEALGTDLGATAVLDAIKGHLIWAAHQPEASAWADYRAEMRQLRHAARRVSGLLPQRQAGPCPHCGAPPGSVVRAWADRKWQPLEDGLSDEVRCTGCLMTWRNREHFLWVNRTTLGLLPDSHPDAVVTLDDARQHVFRAHGIPEATWRSWLMRDHARAEAGQPRRMPERGWDERGKALYRVGDLANLIARRSSDTRRGRKADSERMQA